MSYPRLIVLLSLFIFLCDIHAQKKFGNCREIEPVELNAWIEARRTMLVIDTRVYIAFQNKHIATAIHAPTSNRLKAIADSLDSESIVIVYGQTDDDSLDACLWMAQQGLTAVYSLRGGFMDWENLKFPVAKRKK